MAQFMPPTARLRHLENPFNPLEAFAKSAQLLLDLRREFGNVGVAAAAYNAGPGRVRDWLVRRRPLPGETRAYVRLVTGHSVEEWSGARPIWWRRARCKLCLATCRLPVWFIKIGKHPQKPKPSTANATASSKWYLALPRAARSR